MDSPNLGEIYSRLSSLAEINDKVFTQLKNYVDFVLEYNEKINLIGKSTIGDIWERHIVDSAQLIKYITNKDCRLADLGSGAGFPAIVLSILGVKETYLFEKSYRKCEFLDQARKFSDNKIIIYNENIQEFRGENFDVITSRALGSIDLLLNFSNHLKNNNTYCLFPKGRKVFEELKEAGQKWVLDYDLFDSITSDEGKIVRINKFNSRNGRDKK